MKNVFINLLMAISLIGGVSTVQGAEIRSDRNNRLYCEDCYQHKNLLVSNAEEAGYYIEIKESKHLTFIRENMGMSCPGGGWGMIDKRQPHPKLVPVKTECDEVTDVYVTESNGTVTFKVKYYGGGSTTRKFTL